MKSNTLQKSSALENHNINIESCCKNALDNLNKNIWKALLAKIVHNWKTRSRLNTLNDAQMKDLGLTAADIAEETNKPLWK